jgi:hypothetical protein
MNDVAIEVGVRAAPPASGFSRRTLLKASGAIVVAGAVGGVAALTRDGGPDLPLARASFVSTVGETFTFGGAGLATVKLILDRVADGAGAEPGDADRYVVTFRSDAPIAQGTYEVRHARLGRFLMFVTPGEDREGRPNVHAVFNTSLGGGS